MKKSKFYYDFPLIEIISINKAKEKAASKLHIPFKYTREIETDGLLEQNPRHVEVDFSNVSNSKKYQYHKLFKKYSKQEFNKIVNPFSEIFKMTASFALLLTAVCFSLYKCSQDKKIPQSPQVIQKHMAKKECLVFQNTR